jgi:hypothetical protein
MGVRSNTRERGSVHGTAVGPSPILGDRAHAFSRRRHGMAAARLGRRDTGLTKKSAARRIDVSKAACARHLPDQDPHFARENFAV